jgi:hypothetical protein
LLENDAWRAKGEAGWEYVRESFEIESVIDRHLQVYQQVTAPGTRAGMKAVALP